MSNSNGTSYTARSMNGIITIDDGAGTTIENGTIITDDFTVNNFTATNAIMSGSITCNIINGLNDLTLSNICTLFNNEVNGIIYIGCANTTFIYIGYNTNIYKVLYLGSHASNIFLGGFKFLNNDMNMADDTQDMNIANTQYTGNLHIGTYVNRSGQIKIGNISNTNIIGDIKIISNAINLDVNADFIIGDELLYFNTLHLGNLVNRNVIGGLLVVDKVIDTNVAGTLTIGSTNATTINMGSSTSTTYIKNSRNLIIGQTPETYQIGNSLAGRGVNINTGNNATIIEMYSSLQAGQNYPSSRIYSYGGTSSTNSGELTISSGTIKIEPIGNLTLGMASSTNTFIRNSDALVIGQNPASYLGGAVSAPAMSFQNVSNFCRMDFHSNTVNGTAFDSRIVSTGGTATQLQGTITVASGTTNINSYLGDVNLNSASAISILPTGSSTIGSATTVNNYIRNTTNLIIGANPSTYTVVGNTLAGNGASIYTKDNYSIFDMYSSGNSGQNNTSSRIYSYGGTSVANSGALTLSSGTINITPTGNTNIGTSTTILNTIRSSNGLIIGQDPTTYSYSTGYMTGNGMRFSTDGNVNLIDFHTSTLSGQQDFTSRIRVDGGTTQNSGLLTLGAGNINVESTGIIGIGNSTNTNTIGGIRVVGNILDLKASGTLTIGSATTPSIAIGLVGTSTVFGGQTRIIGSQIDLASAGTLTIGSANTTLLNVGVAGTVALNSPSILIGSTSTTTAIMIGNASINPVKIQTSDRVVMGINPSSYNTSTGSLSGAGVVVGTNGTGPYNAFVDFYSYAGVTQTNSARIIAGGGGFNISNNIPSTPLSLTSNQNINLSPAVGNGVNVLNGGLYLYAGLAYGKGNLTSPHFTQTYSSGMIGPAIPGSSVSPTSLSYSFPVAFGTTPVVTLSTQNNTLNGASWGIILSVAGVSTTGVVLVAYNAKNSAVAVNSWGYNLIAVGGW